MKKVGIIGSGTMGIGIAQLAATAHCEVFIRCQLLTNRKISKNLKTTLNKLAEKGKKISTEKNL